VRLLLLKGANLTIKNRDAQRPIDIARDKKTIEIYEEFKETGDIKLANNYIKEPRSEGSSVKKIAEEDVEKEINFLNMSRSEQE